MRESVGYDKPFNVKYWELDNEPYRKFDPITYAYKCVEYSKAMKMVDPNIEILMANYFTYDSKLKEMLEIAGPYIDVVNKREDLPFEKYKDALDVIRDYNKKQGTHITMCDTEVTFPQEPEGFEGVDGLNHQKEVDDKSELNSMVRWAHGMSGILDYMKFQNLGGDFIFANYWAMVNSYGENLLNVTRENTFLSAPGQAFRFLNLTKLSMPVVVNNTKPNKGIIVQTGWRANKKEFVVIVENVSNQAVNNTFDFSSLGVRSMKCTGSYEVYADNMMNYNSQMCPDTIKTKKSNPTLSGIQVHLVSKPYSAAFWLFERDI